MPEPDQSETLPVPAPPPGDDFVPGVPKRVGRFEVRKVLGNGTFGRVLLGYDPTLRREVAIKQPFGAGLTPDSLEGFLKEAWATAEIHHANVCPVYEAGTEGNLPFIVMKYVRGGSLAELLKRAGGPLPPRQACAIAQKLAQGLAAAHARKVVHRDLKPANILYDDEAREVLIGDFGLVQFADQAASGVKGTAAYMSPEQWSPNKPWPVAAPADLYSLGVILFELLTGRVPFSGGVYELMFAHCQEPPPVPSSACAGVDARLDAIVLKAMSKRPADRFASAPEFAAALADYLRATGARDEDIVLLAGPAHPPPGAATAAVADAGLQPTVLPTTTDLEPQSEQLCCPNCQAGVEVARGRADVLSCGLCSARFSSAAGRQAALRLSGLPNRPSVRAPLPSGALLFVTRSEWLPATRGLRLATLGLVASVALLIVNAVIIVGFEPRALEEMPHRAASLAAGGGLSAALVLLALGRGRAARVPPGVRGRTVARLSAVAAWVAVPCVAAYFAAAGTPSAQIAGAVALLCLLASEFGFNRYLGAIGPYFGRGFPHSLTRIAKTYLLIALGSAAGGVVVAAGWEPTRVLLFARAVVVLLAGVSGCLGFVCVPICFITSVWLSAAATLAAGRHVREEAS